MSDLSVLTETELAELGGLAKCYLLAHLMRNFAESDKLRTELMAWGAWPPEHGWHPVFESQEHRYARFVVRGER